MARNLLTSLSVVCLLLESRVCFGQSSDYSTSTAIGFCSHAIYLSLQPTSRGNVGLINPANDADNLLGGIKKFAGRKTAYPYVEMYLGLVGSVSAGNLIWLNVANTRQSFISLLVAKVQEYPEMSGVYVDFLGLRSADSSFYSAFISELKTALTARNLKLITALPWESSTQADIYFNPTLPTLPFNVIKTHEDMYSAVTNTHPISPLFAMASPFNDELKTIALLFGTTNTLGAPQSGEGFAYSSNTFYTYNSPAALGEKLNFVTGINLAGVAVFSLDQAGSTNAEMLRQRPCTNTSYSSWLSCSRTADLWRSNHFPNTTDNYNNDCNDNHNHNSNNHNDNDTDYNDYDNSYHYHNNYTDNNNDYNAYNNYYYHSHNNHHNHTDYNDYDNSYHYHNNYTDNNNDYNAYNYHYNYSHNNHHNHSHNNHNHTDYNNYDNSYHYHNNYSDNNNDYNAYNNHHNNTDYHYYYHSYYHNDYYSDYHYHYNTYNNHYNAYNYHNNHSHNNDHNNTDHNNDNYPHYHYNYNAYNYHYNHTNNNHNNHTNNNDDDCRNNYHRRRQYDNRCVTSHVQSLRARGVRQSRCGVLRQPEGGYSIHYRVCQLWHRSVKRYGLCLPTVGGESIARCDKT
uniref:GH18 domain-containing protein n=1 Tax=Anopheles culicifacies TaxID=139723 RepID=A0A182M4D1_9DIPT